MLCWYRSGYVLIFFFCPNSGNQKWSGIEWNATMISDLKAIYASNSSEAVRTACLGNKGKFHVSLQTLLLLIYIR